MAATYPPGPEPIMATSYLLIVKWFLIVWTKVKNNGELS
jgi:hypothetical protein